MNFLQFLNAIEELSPEAVGSTESRRRVVGYLGKLGGRLAVAAAPAVLGSVFSPVRAQTTPGSINDALNFLLRIQYLQAALSSQGISGGAPWQVMLRGQFSSSNLAALDRMRTDEANHIQVLRTALGAAGIAVPPLNEFDFTGSRGGARPAIYPAVFSSAAVYLAVAQVLKDLSVRAYNGITLTLIPNRTALQAVVYMHSVQARHAARLRTMRRAGPTSINPGQAAPVGSAESERRTSPKSWLSGQDAGGPYPPHSAPVYGPGANSVFPNEGNTVQAGINLLTTTTGGNIPALAFSEAFDEPLDPVSVRTIARDFTVMNSTFFS